MIISKNKAQKNLRYILILDLYYIDIGQKDIGQRHHYGINALRV